MFKIYTLGDFDIRKDDKSILESIGSQHQQIKLLKYFITFNGRKMLPYKIIDDLWSEEEFKNPLGVLRTHISRLRHMIDFEKYNTDAFFTINYINGYYLFELQENCQVDFIELEKYINQDKSNLSEQASMDIYKKAISLYKGEYLEDIYYEDWVMPARNKINRLYITGLAKYLEKLKENSMDLEIVSTCEEAINYRPYEEFIHIYLIESLINLGQRKCALSHYQFSTKKIYTDMGGAPSNKMKEIYKKIITKEEIATNLNLIIADEKLSEKDEPAGTLVADKFHFTYIYNLIKRIKTIDESIVVILAIVTIYNSGYIESPESDLKEKMLVLLDVMDSKLRIGDVVTQWNENQALVLFFSLKETDIEPISSKLKYYYKSKIKKANSELNIKFKKI